MAAVFMLSSCEDDSVIVHAKFSTTKDVYELYEDIFLTNESTAENADVVACKWEWNGQHIWAINPTDPISFDKVGEYEITLTAVADKGRHTDTYTKTITIQDTNIRPVADFTYSPTTGIKAGGDPVKFTDKSTDADGTIVSWVWTFGSTVVNEQNPEFSFTEFGEIPISLTVTDNMKGTNTKYDTIYVEKGINSLELLWAKSYDDDNEAFVKFTSPATNADGSVIYAFSSGYNLAAFSKDGENLWTFNMNIHGPNAYCNDGTKNSTSCTPSVDSDGTVYVAVGYNELNYSATTSESGVFAVKSDGSQKWYFMYGNARYIAVIPVLIGDQVITSTKYNPTKSDYPDLWANLGTQNNGQALNRETGTFAQMLKVKQGNYGGAVAFSDGKLIMHCNDKYGSRIYFMQSDGNWEFYDAANGNNQTPKALGYYQSTTLESASSSQMALTKDGLIYILYKSSAGRVSNSSILYCYDVNEYVQDTETAFEPKWTVGIDGQVARYCGDGAVIGEDGTIYVTTSVTGDEKARVTAVSPEGTVKWTSEADSEIYGCAAVDNQGYIYYNDAKAGKLVKISPEDGSKLSEITLGTTMYSSPTISVDGTIYCTGMMDGKPTLFAVSSSATGCGAGWSQLGGNPSKTCVMNVN